MTVKDLKELLAHYDDDTDVVIDLGHDLNPLWLGDCKIRDGWLNDAGDDLLYEDEDGDSGHDACLVIRI